MTAIRPECKPVAEGMAGPKEIQMLWTVTVVLLILWAVGFFGFGAAVGYWIHILIILAVISLIYNLLAGRRAL